jgi:hypothetical protein
MRLHTVANNGQFKASVVEAKCLMNLELRRLDVQIVVAPRNNRRDGETAICRKVGYQTRLAKRSLHNLAHRRGIVDDPCANLAYSYHPLLSTELSAQTRNPSVVEMRSERANAANQIAN